MSEVLITASEAERPIPLVLVTAAGCADRLAGMDALTSGSARSADFTGKADQLAIAPGADGAMARVLVGVGERAGPMALRAAAAKLPAGDYRLEEAGGTDAAALALGWALGTYRFDRYKPSARKPKPRLVVDETVDLAAVRELAHAAALAREMVDTPAMDMGPRQVEAIAREVAEQYGATLTVTEGADLRAGCPCVWAVGAAAAADRLPRMLELTWGEADAPRVALVGKGVVFDTGGLDIKSAAGMRIMKKDMGGAAHALALGRLVMAAGLRVRLSVLLPVVENAISGEATRPGDVLATRKGLSVEIGNTDAEGRLILADALTRAGELEPELTVDFATLTGAARVALGPELPPLFTDDDAFADDVTAAGRRVADPVWRMPLWAGYEPALEADIADLRNDPADWAQAGAVTAALFLKRFAPTTGVWAHVDLMAWNPRNRPGWPAGAEFQAARAVFEVLKARYGGGSRA